MSGRIELKYLVDHRQKEILERVCRPYLAAAAFTDDQNSYSISSLYFDSPSLIFYDEKIDGELLRTKVRLRGYGTDWLKMAPCFLEIKRKVDARIVKYRQKFERFTPELMDPASWCLGDDREGAALVAALYHYALRPAVQVIYLRQTFESPFANTLRLAFDSQLYALLPGQRFERALADDPRHQCLGDRQFIFEIKSDGRLPEWLRRGLEAAEVVQRALSKYVIAIEKLQLERAEIGVYA